MYQLTASAGGICFRVGWIWIIVAAAQDSKVLWAVLSFCIPIVAVVYGAMNFERLKVPTILLIIGIVFGGSSRLLL